jgi:hypothetical protein
MTLKQIYIRNREAIENIRFNGFYPVHYYNFWKDQRAKDVWFSRFVEHQGLLKNYSGKINFYSVLGSLQNLEKLHGGVNLFFSGENMHAERFADFRLLCEQKNFDLYIDFDTTLSEKSIRFPLWLLYMFSPDSSYEDITKRVDQLRYSLKDNRKGFCSLVASHDWNGIRGEMIDALSEIDTISSGGKFRNNTDALNTQFANNKHNFIGQYRFNICPENSNAPGYVTEKIFQSIEAGCIPIYWGADNQPEPGILNQDAILFWTINGDNRDVIDKIRQLQHESDYFRAFMAQPRFLPNADMKIIEMFDGLKEEILKIIDSQRRGL